MKIRVLKPVRVRRVLRFGDNSSYNNRKNVAISEFFEKNYRKDVEDMKEGYEKSSANYKFYFASKMDSNYLSAFDSFIENNRTCNNVADFIKFDK